MGYIPKLSIDDFCQDPENWVEATGRVFVKHGGIGDVLATASRLGAVCSRLELETEYIPRHNGWLVRRS